MKLILFDWGNIVESHTTGYACHNAWDDLMGICGYKGEQPVFELLGKYHLSKITNEDDFEKVYYSIADELKLSEPFETFKDNYKKIFDKVDYYKDVSEYEKSLKDKCKIGILSDLTIYDKERIDKQVDLSKYDYVFLSFELGLKKPNKDIFEYVQEHVPFKPDEILFIDDREDNVNTAKEIGWNAYQVTGLELDKIKEVCKSFIEQ